jgi:hypothetical protein
MLLTPLIICQCHTGHVSHRGWLIPHIFRPLTNFITVQLFSIWDSWRIILKTTQYISGFKAHADCTGSLWRNARNFRNFRREVAVLVGPTYALPIFPPIAISVLPRWLLGPNYGLTRPNAFVNWSFKPAVPCNVPYYQLTHIECLGILHAYTRVTTIIKVVCIKCKRGE